ncbi:MAG: rhomboid family intramembrane serine protease [Chloroflexi bacterium]|nr:rhomboid family intramembrane serine protease [Chloroflexota bacterium]
MPLNDLERPRRPPVVTRLLIAANALVWIYVLTFAGDPSAVSAFYDRWSFDLATPTVVTLLSHQFVHAGWLHLLGNLLYLWIFGDNVEDRMGRGRFLVFYLLAGAIAAVGQGLVSPGPMVGASGAIAAVLGAYVVVSPGAKIRTLIFLGIFITVVTLPAVVVIGEWIVIQVISGLSAMRITQYSATATVAYAAHVFGFASGILLARAFGAGRR